MQGLPCRQPGERHRGGMNVIDACRLARGHRRVERCVLRIGAPQTDQREYRLSDGEVRDARSHRSHLAGKIAAGNHGQRQIEALSHQSAADLPVDRIHADRMNPHENLSRFRRGPLYLLEAQHLRPRRSRGIEWPLSA